MPKNWLGEVLGRRDTAGDFARHLSTVLDLHSDDPAWQHQFRTSPVEAIELGSDRRVIFITLTNGERLRLTVEPA